MSSGLHGIGSHASPLAVGRREEKRGEADCSPEDQPDFLSSLLSFEAPLPTDRVQVALLATRQHGAIYTETLQNRSRLQ